MDAFAARIAGSCILSFTAFGVGCGQSSTDVAAAPASSESPAVASSQASTDTSTLRLTAERFLAALLGGNPAEADDWLTPAAARHVAKQPGLLEGMGPSDVDLEISEVRLVSNNEAVAQCLLTPTNSTAAEELLCLLKRNGNKWGVSGLAWESATGSEPRVIRFEPVDKASSAEQYVGQAPLMTTPRTAASPDRVSGDLR